MKPHFLCFLWTFALAGCATVHPEQCTPPERLSLPEGTRACYQKAIARDYLQRVQTEVLDAWLLPPGVPRDRCAIVQFSLRADGSFETEPKVVAGDSIRFRENAIAAVHAAAPFDPPPAGAECVSGVPVLATFTNPIAKP